MSKLLVTTGRTFFRHSVS